MAIRRSTCHPHVSAPARVASRTPSCSRVPFRYRLTPPRDLRKLGGTGLLLLARFVEGPGGVAEGEQATAAEAYERHSGAASAPLPSSYRRREPEGTVLHAAVREHLATFL